MFHKVLGFLICSFIAFAALSLSAPKAKALTELEQATQDAYYVIENFYNDTPDHIADYAIFYAYDFSNFNGNLQNNGIRTLVYKLSDVSAGNFPQYDGILSAFQFGGQSQSYVSFNVSIVFAGTSNTPYYYGTGNNFTRRPSQGHVWNLGIRSQHLVNPFIIHGSVSSSAVYGLPYDNDTLRAVYKRENFVPGDSSVDNPSPLGFIAKYYSMQFICQHVSDDSYSDFIGKSYPVVLKDVYSDNGYNMISLQVPALYLHKDVQFWGAFIFTAKPDMLNKYTVNDFKISFAVDNWGFLNDSDEYINYDYNAPEDFYRLLSVSTVIGDSGNYNILTTNSIRFLYNTTTMSYTNRRFWTFDFSGGSNYPFNLQFYSVGSINGMTSGSFIFNVSYSSITDNDTGEDLTPDEIAQQEREGRDDNDDTEDQSPYIPRVVRYPDDRVSFDDPNFTGYDFTPVKSLFDALFSWYLVDMLIACSAVGLLGYVLFGRGD